MWYTLPWAFDEFFHLYVPFNWITEVHVFHPSSQTTTTTIKKSRERTLDVSDQTLASCLRSLPHVILDDHVETLHLSFNNESLDMSLANLRKITLINSFHCLNYCSHLPSTIRSVRILSFGRLPNYMPPDWSVILPSLSTLPQLTSLRIFLYDWLKTVDNHSCQLITKAASLYIDFTFCFRHQFDLPHVDNLRRAFEVQTKFIKQLCHSIHRLSEHKSIYYVMEKDAAGLTLWS